MSTSQIALLASVQQFLDRQHGLYIDGAPCAAQSENRLTVWDPATGQAIATTADASPADVDRAVMSAWRAFVDRRWAGRTPADRERILLRFADLVEQHGEELVRDMGAALLQADRLPEWMKETAVNMLCDKLADARALAASWMNDRGEP